MDTDHYLPNEIVIFCPLIHDPPSDRRKAMVGITSSTVKFLPKGLFAAFC